MKLVSTEDFGLCYSIILSYPLNVSIFTVSCILLKKQIQLSFIDYSLQLYLVEYSWQVTTEIHAFYVTTTFQTPDKFRVYMRTIGFVMFSSIVQNYLSDIAFGIHKCKYHFSLIRNTFGYVFSFDFKYRSISSHRNAMLIILMLIRYIKKTFYH